MSVQKITMMFKRVKYMTINNTAFEKHIKNLCKNLQIFQPVADEQFFPIVRICFDISTTHVPFPSKYLLSLLPKNSYDCYNDN